AALQVRLVAARGHNAALARRADGRQRHGRVPRRCTGWAAHGPGARVSAATVGALERKKRREAPTGGEGRRSRGRAGQEKGGPGSERPYPSLRSAMSLFATGKPGAPRTAVRFGLRATAGGGAVVRVERFES